MGLGTSAARRRRGLFVGCGERGGGTEPFPLPFPRPVELLPRPLPLPFRPLPLPLPFPFLGLYLVLPFSCLRVSWCNYWVEASGDPGLGE